MVTQKLESAKCGKHGNVKTTKLESTKARNFHEDMKHQSVKTQRHENLKARKREKAKSRKQKNTRIGKRGKTET